MVLAVDRMGDNDIVLTGSKDHYIKVRSWEVKVTEGQGQWWTPGGYNGASCRQDGG